MSASPLDEKKLARRNQLRGAAMRVIQRRKARPPTWEKFEEKERRLAIEKAQQEFDADVAQEIAGLLLLDFSEPAPDDLRDEAIATARSAIEVWRSDTKRWRS